MCVMKVAMKTLTGWGHWDQKADTPKRPRFDEDEGDSCPRCRLADRVVYDRTTNEWRCTRCATHWPADPRDPRLPQ